MSIFDNGDKIMTNLFSILKPNGRIFIFDSLNIYSFNFISNLRRSKKKEKDIWFKNMYSTQFFKDTAKRFKKKCKFFEFRLKMDLKKKIKKILDLDGLKYCRKKK